MKSKIIITLVLALSLSGCVQSSKSNQESLSLPTPTITETETMSNKVKEQKQAEKLIIKTSKGDVEIKLYLNEAPNTVKNFTDKARGDYYKGLTFHRVEDWVVQGGDPLGTGTGGEDMATEINSMPFKVGSVGVARGQNIKISNDSQFFICTKDCGFLNNQYANFGEVVKGMEVVNKIEIGDKIFDVKAE